MPYLNLDLDYFSHPKTRRLAGLIGRNSEVLPLRLWCYCGKHHCVDGRLSGYGPQEVESIVGWWGKSGAMVESMLKVGLLRELDDGYEVVDFVEHNGHLSAFKQKAKNAAIKRWSAHSDDFSNATSNAKTTSKQCPNHTNLTTLPKGRDRVPKVFDTAAPILYLNQVAGTRFDPGNKANVRLVKARYHEGRTIDDFKSVVDKKASQWLTDEKMSQYLRPSTLFSATNFESYLNERQEVKEKYDFIRQE